MRVLQPKDHDWCHDTSEVSGRDVTCFPRETVFTTSFSDWLNFSSFSRSISKDSQDSSEMLLCFVRVSVSDDCTDCRL